MAKLANFTQNTKFLAALWLQELNKNMQEFLEKMKFSENHKTRAISKKLFFNPLYSTVNQRNNVGGNVQSGR
jgi:hypothetical protein